MKRSIVIFLMTAVLSTGMIVYGCIFVNSTTGKATLTEESFVGDSDAAEGLEVGFRADSGSELHWVNTYEYGSGETDSDFKRGEMAVKSEAAVYENIRFTGWSSVPYVTRLEYDRLGGLQETKIHDYYDEIQQDVLESGKAARGVIRTGEYIDYYPVSFRFQFGTRSYNSSAALTGLKIYEENGSLSGENAASYDRDVDMYVTFNDMFRIPVIENEYQRYRISAAGDHDEKTSLGYRSRIVKPLGDGADFYEVDPIIVVQEENIRDGMNWEHPDMAAGDAEGESNGESEGREAKSASEYGLKNRLLFVVNNRTAMGENVDISQIRGGYGVYELPVDTEATATIGKSRRSWTLPDPKPLMDQMAMVYPLDEGAEYVELSLSEDHRHLAVFSVADGKYFAELIDADLWESCGRFELFPAAEKLTYSWGNDGSLAMTNHEGHAAVLYRDGEAGYGLLYSGRPGDDFDSAFFDERVTMRENSYARYRAGVDSGLAVTVKEGKAALVQNPKAGSGENSIRNAALECAIIDERGVLYRGLIKSDMVDLDYDMTAEEVQEVIEYSGGTRADLMKTIIRPVRNENHARWNDEDR